MEPSEANPSTGFGQQVEPRSGFGELDLAGVAVFEGLEHARIFEDPQTLRLEQSAGAIGDGSDADE